MSVATFAGLGAITLWSSLAALTTLTAGVPPFQVLALSLSVGALLGYAIAFARGRLLATRPSAGSFALGIFGIFGYHALFFSALKLAPPAEANLINYFWPILIVIFSNIFYERRLEWKPMLGACLGLCATLLMALGKSPNSVADPVLARLGYLLAFGAAVTWSSYSVLSRRFAHIATESLAPAIAASAILGLCCHFAFETWAQPSWPLGWIALLLLGLGPVGAAFFLWDVGMKRGDVTILGVFAYATPVLSTIALILIGTAEPSVRLIGACGLIVGAAIIATRR